MGLNTLNKSYDDFQIQTLLGSPFYTAIEYWVHVNNNGAASASTLQDRLFKLKVTKKIIDECDSCISSKKLAEITLSDLHYMYKKLEASSNFNQEDETRKKWQKFICTVYINLFQTHVISTNPTYGWEAVHCSSKKTPLIIETTLNSFLDFTPKTSLDFRDYGMFTLAADTGIRIGSLRYIETTDLQIQQINGIRQIVQIEINHAKWGVKYKVSVGENTSKAILDYLDNHRPKSKSKFLFLSEKGGLLSYTGAKNRFDDRSSAIGSSTNITPHMFRATFATEAASHNTSISTIKDLLGVKSNDVAYGYIRDVDNRTALELNRANSLVDKIRRKNLERDGNLQSAEKKIELMGRTENSLQERIPSKPNLELQSNQVMSLSMATTDNQLNTGQTTQNQQILQTISNSYSDLFKNILNQSDKSQTDIMFEAQQLMQQYQNLLSIVPNN